MNILKIIIISKYLFDIILKEYYRIYDYLLNKYKLTLHYIFLYFILDSSKSNVNFFNAFVVV